MSAQNDEHAVLGTQLSQRLAGTGQEEELNNWMKEMEDEYGRLEDHPLVRGRKYSLPFYQFFDQADEVKKRHMLRDDSSILDNHEVTDEELDIRAKDYVKREWVKQGIWKVSWDEKNYPVGGWQHEQAFVPVTDPEQKASNMSEDELLEVIRDRARQGQSSARVRQLLAEAERIRIQEFSASRPFHQFNHQVSLVRESILEARIRESPRDNGIDVNTQAYRIVKWQWERRKIWNQTWGILPGTKWNHEIPQTELLVEEFSRKMKPRTEELARYYLALYGLPCDKDGLAILLDDTPGVGWPDYSESPPASWESEQGGLGSIRSPIPSLPSVIPATPSERSSTREPLRTPFRVSVTVNPNRNTTSGNSGHETGSSPNNTLGQKRPSGESPEHPNKRPKTGQGSGNSISGSSPSHGLNPEAEVPNSLPQTPTRSPQPQTPTRNSQNAVSGGSQGSNVPNSQSSPSGTATGAQPPEGSGTTVIMESSLGSGTVSSTTSFEIPNAQPNPNAPAVSFINISVSPESSPAGLVVAPEPSLRRSDRLANRAPPYSQS